MFNRVVLNCAGGIFDKDDLKIDYSNSTHDYESRGHVVCQLLCPLAGQKSLKLVVIRWEVETPANIH